MAARFALVAGDMLAAEHGTFDAVVSMDALIHYNGRSRRRQIAGLAQANLAQDGVHAGPAH
jgi:2-polyprenyl-3-methyl-5-hydroxy-6-metoxy-1,4-benzoquinol methylase